jgi:hypothetical protein
VNVKHLARENDSAKIFAERVALSGIAAAWHERRLGEITEDGEVKSALVAIISVHDKALDLLKRRFAQPLE